MPCSEASQGRDRIEVGRPPGWDDAEEQADRTRQPHGDQHRGRADRSRQRGHPPHHGHGAEPHGTADNPPQARQDQGFHQELQQHISAAGPQGLAQADLLVRSLTDTNMMFMIPIPPTSRDTAPMAASIMVSPPVIVPTIVRASCWERTAKSSSSRILCRCLSRLVIWNSAAPVLASSRASTLMKERLPHRWDPCR